MSDDNILEFKQKSKDEYSIEIFTLTMNENQDGQYEVYMDICEGFEDQDVLEALVSAVSKFAIDQGLVEEGTLNVIATGEDTTIH